ncbi:Trypsin-like peptidase domain-containing protein [Cupriavidus sp. YR651]|uniref:S1 family peptidase n=1 Tax=Cupriavidus sp. YR651 TaxID=1855315 RepID=UPI00088F0692|nr:serine protease [Cupriavidus sp. YR651]SDB98595.1 Trypsin-like peptidase domain-containing protein [Cupriavidus sp. YR651]
MPAGAVGLGQFTANVYAVRAQGAQATQARTGSGVAVGPNQVVTACSLLAGARSIAVVRDKVTYEAALAAPDTERNLCLVNVPNLPGNGETLSATPAVPALGQKMVIAALLGQAVAVRESTVVGLQAGDDGRLSAIELSGTPEAGANGGALFDDGGRLVGILVSDNTSANGRQRAVPAAWVRDISARGAAALASYRPAANNTAAVAAGTTASDARASGDSPRVGEVWQYVLTDNLTRKRTDVTYRVDRIENERVIFNQGARIERADGTLERINTPSAGEFDVASPPSGWVPAGVKVGARWKYSYRQHGSGAQTDLEGIATGESDITVPGGTYRAIRIAYRGYRLQPISGARFTQQYKAVAWYAPDIGRVVRFEASTAQVTETLELAAHRLE